MALPGWQATIQRENGDIVPSAVITVIDESTGLAADLYSDRAGTTPLGTDGVFSATTEGFARFYAAPGEYRITAEDSGTGFSQTWRYVPVWGPGTNIGTAIIESSTGTQTGGAALNLRRAEYASLAALKAAADNSELTVGGRYGTETHTGGNFQGANFYELKDGATSRPADDNGHIIHVSGGSGFLYLEGLFLDGVISVSRFGGLLDGSDDYTAFNRCLQYCKNNGRRTLHIGVGTLGLATAPDLDTTNNSITIAGEPGATWQLGSTLPATTIAWVSTASSPMMRVKGSFYKFQDFAVENRGDGVDPGGATDFLEYVAGYSCRMHNVSFLRGANHTVFTRSVIYCDADSSMAYSHFSAIRFTGAATKFLFIDAGSGTEKAQTPILFDQRCLFEDSTGVPLDIVYVKDRKLDALIFRDCTFNQQGGDATDEFTIVNTTDTPKAVTIDNLTIENCEWDKNNNTGASTNLALRLQNIRNFSFNDNVLNCGGDVDHFAALDNVNISSASGNFYKSCVSYVLDCQPNCNITGVGINHGDSSNTVGFINPGAEGVIQVPYGVNPIIDLAKTPGHGHSVYRIDVTDGSSFEVVRKTGTGENSIPGKVITVNIRNVSGGGMGSINWASYFKLSPGVTAPANGNNRSITFVWDGTNFTEIGRKDSDVPN